jgi:hypothetical protein
MRHVRRQARLQHVAAAMHSLQAAQAQSPMEHSNASRGFQVSTASGGYLFGLSVGICGTFQQFRLFGFSGETWEDWSSIDGGIPASWTIAFGGIGVSATVSPIASDEDG